jgi:glycosyltransferase involved in cell wall biosynthesis
LTRFGVEARKLRVVPSPVPSPSPSDAQLDRGRRWLVVGRPSPEKGIRELLEDWPKATPLDIIGSDTDQIRLPPGKDIRCLGTLERREILRRMPAYMGLVFPSLCFETQGIVLAEACASGLPIIVRRENVGVELISEFKCGLIFEDSLTLQVAISMVEDERQEFSDCARIAFETRFSEESWVSSIEDVYGEAIKNHG